MDAPPRGIGRVLGLAARDAALLALAATIAGVSCFYLVRDYDVPFHLAVGRYILETGSLPAHDPFSHTFRNEIWHNHSPLFQVVIALVDRLSGFTGLSIMQALCAALLAVVPAVHAVRGGATPHAAAVLSALVVILYRGMICPRPHVFGWLMFQAALVVLIGSERRGRPAWLLALLPVHLLWLGLHGSSPILIPLLLVFAAGAALRRDFPRALLLGLLTLVCVAVALTLKPDTFTLAAGHMASDYLARFTPEWRPFGVEELFLTWSGAGILVFWLLALAGTIARSGLIRTGKGSAADRNPIHHTATLLGLQVLALTSYRMAPLFLIGAAPLWLPGAAAILADAWRGIRARIAPAATAAGGRLAADAGALMLCAACAFGVVHLMPEHRPGGGIDRDRFPIEAVEFMKRENVGGRIYNAFNWGGYLMLERYPPEGVFVDGRSITLYSPEFLERFIRAYGDPRVFEELADEYGVDSVLMPVRSNVIGFLLAHIEGSLRWRRVYLDEKAAVYVRRYP